MREDTRLQAGCARLRKAIDAPACRASREGDRPARGAGEAVRDRTGALQDGRSGEVVEAAMNGVFDPRDQGWRLARRRVRSDDRACLGRLRTWLKAGMLEPDGWVSHPDTGTPQGGVRSPV